jgi:hypothetical protein
MSRRATTLAMAMSAIHGIRNSLPAALHRARRLPSRAVRSSSPSAPTRAARCVFRRIVAASPRGSPRTAPFHLLEQWRWRRASTRSGFWRAAHRTCASPPGKCISRVTTANQSAKLPLSPMRLRLPIDRSPRHAATLSRRLAVAELKSANETGCQPLRRWTPTFSRSCRRRRRARTGH